GGGIRDRPAADEAVPLIDCRVVLVPEDGNGDVTLVLIALVVDLGLRDFTVQRASRSFCRIFAGLSFQASGILPALMSAFSSSVFLCFGAAMTVASTICPPMARYPALARCLSKRANRFSTAPACTR